MKKFILVFVLCCLMVTSSWAVKKVAIYKSNANGYMKQLNQMGASPGSVFGLTQDEAFSLVRTRTDFNGVTHYRYQQTYKGFPVWGMQTIISRDRSNKVVRLHGNLVLETPADIAGIPSSLNPKGALKKMKDKHKEKNISKKWNFGNEEFGTCIYVDRKGKAHLAYMVSFFADNETGDPSRPVFFISPQTGNVLHSYDNLQSADGIGPGGNLKVGYYYYGTHYGPFGVTQNGSTCTMDTPDVKSVDLNHGTSGTTPFSYTCFENTHKEINGAYCPLNDAQYFGQVVYDMYQAWYGVAVLPFKLSMKVHYGTNHENAYWTGDSMLFGDGYTTFYPLVSLDVSGHEVSHGFTDFNSDLIYSGESGGINEAFSDMAGEASEFYMKGDNDFMCGFDIFKAPGQALRYLYDPPADGRSIDHVDDYYPGMDVHYSSGIFNKVFWLLADTYGWGTQASFNIFVKANQDYWEPSTNFQQGAEGAQTAAADYGYSDADVVAAFAVVGISLGGPPTSITVVSPNGGEVWAGGSTHNILWTSTGSITNVKIFYTLDGKAWTLLTGSTPNDGSYSWTLPTVSKTKRKCRVKITSLDETVEDTSDDKFKITN
jgi:Zn-dependent metalloprotease